MVSKHIERDGTLKIHFFKSARYFLQKNVNRRYCSPRCGIAPATSNHQKIWMWNQVIWPSKWPISQKIAKISQNCHIAGAIAPDPLYIFGWFKVAGAILHLELQYGRFTFFWKNIWLTWKIKFSEFRLVQWRIRMFWYHQYLRNMRIYLLNHLTFRIVQKYALVAEKCLKTPTPRLCPTTSILSPIPSSPWTLNTLYFIFLFT
jgi:hypothetical protein